jgi:hypothetical protein
MDKPSIDGLAEQPTPGTRRAGRRPRLTVGALMLTIALIGLWLGWYAYRVRRVAYIDIGASETIAFGGRPHTVESLQGLIEGSPVEEVVLRVPSNAPYRFVARVAVAIQAAGVNRIRFSPAGNLTRPQSNAAATKAGTPGL